MRVIYVDDEMPALDNFRLTAGNFSEIGELNLFNDGFEALAYAENNPVDVAFLDMEMPGIHGLELAKKLKEKGFSCKHPFAMYNESGDFCELFTSADVDYSVKTSFGYFRHVYDYDDFGPEDFMAPTIAQVLKWLRTEKSLHIEIRLFTMAYGFDVIHRITNEKLGWSGTLEYSHYEDAAIAAVAAGDLKEAQAQVFGTYYEEGVALIKNNTDKCI